MLRRALDAVEPGPSSSGSTQQSVTENTSLDSSSGAGPSWPASSSGPSGRPAYGSLTTTSSLPTSAEEPEEEYNEEEDEGEFLLEEDEEDEWEEDEDEAKTTPPLSLLQRVWQGLKTVVMVVANVENLWDSDERGGGLLESASPPPRRRDQLVVLFWFVVLAASYAAERSSFKLLVDRAGPFRLFAVEMITSTHALTLTVGLGISFLSGAASTHALGIPLVDVGLMSLLDTISLLLVFLTGMHVPPTLTVILVQFTLPLTVFLTQVVHPDGRCSFCRGSAEDSPDRRSDQDSPLADESERGDLPPPPPTSSLDREALYRSAENGRPPPEDAPLPGWGGLSAVHLWGSLIILLAVLLALLPALYSIANPDFFIYADTIPKRTAYNTLLYVSSCVPAAASQLYKEYIFLHYKQPVNVVYLNLLLSVFQLVCASIMSPLVFSLQGLGDRDNWMELYRSADFSENFLDGLRCFLGFLSVEDQKHKYPEEARCRYSVALAVVHAFSIISVGVSVNKIVNAGATNVAFRGISAGIILAVLCMHNYDMSTPDFNYGPAVDALNLVCLLLLILGSEVYHRVSLQESTFETVYPEVTIYNVEE